MWTQSLAFIWLKHPERTLEPSTWSDGKVLGRLKTHISLFIMLSKSCCYLTRSQINEIEAREGPQED